MEILKSVRTACPLVHHITNTVTINDCANATLAIGASPAMVPSAEEAPELAAVASALVLNIGTSDAPEIEAMLLAGKVAKKRGIPVVFDPVGGGAMPYRQKTVFRIMEDVRPTVVKGNAAEMSFLAGFKSEQRGVDSLEKARVEAVIEIARRWSCVAVATDEIDLVSDGRRVISVRGGYELQGRVCGTGCMSASVQAALAAASREDPLRTAAAACLVMKLAGEEAERISRKIQAGYGVKPGLPLGLSTFRWAFMDALSWIDDEALEKAFAEKCEVRDA